MEFKDRLKKAIGKESVNSFAERCGMTEGVLRKYLSGPTLPGLENLISIAKAADINIAWLATGEGPMKQDEDNLIHEDLLALIIETYEEREKSEQNISPQDKAHSISMIYGIFHNDEGIQELKTLEQKKALIHNTISAVENFFYLLRTAKGSRRLRARKVLVEAYTKVMTKEEAENEVDDLMSSLALEEHFKKGTLKWPPKK